MLNHDDLLTAEQDNATLIQNLQTHYQLKSEEANVLDHVHERLAHFSGTLPLAQSSTEETSGRPVKFAQVPISTRGYIGSSKKMRYFDTLVAVLIVGILIGTLAFTFGIVHGNRIGFSTIVGSGNSSTTVVRLLTLVPTQTHPLPSQQALQTTRNILYQRFVSDGFKGAQVQLLTIHNQPEFDIELPNISSSQEDVINTLTEKGQLDFWGTGTQNLMDGDTFDPGQYTQYNPGGKPLFTGADLNPNSLAVTQDSITYHFVIDMAMQKHVAARFTEYTASHIGDALTITLDNKVVTSPTIMSAISGRVQISGDFAQAQAKALASVLKYGPLPISLKAA